MKKTIFIHFFLLFITSSFAQNIAQRIENAYRQFEADSQMRHAISSLYVINAKTGEVVFDKNSQIGLAPASTQKIITAATAFELLGKSYQYKTVFAGDENQIIISGSYDPTFGSWRYTQTKDSVIFGLILERLKKAGISNVKQFIVYTNDVGVPPSGWITEDIGNYYGASAQLFNWKENQYDLGFFPAKNVGDPANLDTSTYAYYWEILNGVKTGKAGSGDNAYIYFVPGSFDRLVKGTIPAGVSRFSISGADPVPNRTFGWGLQKYMEKNKMYEGRTDIFTVSSPSLLEPRIKSKPLFSYNSPSLDSIIYWFLQKSINLYGEALVKTFAYEKKGFGSTDSGVVIVKDFWKQKGLDVEELNIMDGSGLSPQNRVTTHAQVEILKFAKTKEWFPYFYAALPTYNGMKMKSGSITDVKGYCGYQKSSDGNEYIFSFLVNNYNGSSSTVVNKMYQVLDVLK